MDQKTMQQKALQLDMRREQAKQLQEEIMRLESQLQEIENIRESMNALEKEKSGSEALVPLGAGIFISGKLGDTKEVFVSAGAGVVIKKTVPDAAKFLDEKIVAVKKAIEEIDAEIRKISISASAISREMQGLSE